VWFFNPRGISLLFLQKFYFKAFKNKKGFFLSGVALRPKPFKNF